jgi:hypothetical protein
MTNNTNKPSIDSTNRSNCATIKARNWPRGGAEDDYSDLYDRSRISDFDQQRIKKDRFRNNKLHWEQIPRANNPLKPLQEKAVNLLSVIVHKLRKTDSVTFNHNYLTRITKSKKDQNVNLLKQLADILDISFHAKVTLGSSIHRNCYVITHTPKGRSIIENAKVLFMQKHFVGNMAVIPTKEPSTGDGENIPCAEFFPLPSIYKEEVLENRSMKSNFKENSFLEDGVGGKTESNDNQTPLSKPQQPIPSSVEPRSAHEGAGRYVEDKDLHSFYPLTSQDASQLRANSGRDFSLNAMNEILLDMSKRLTDRFFQSKKSFLSYMSKVFANEKRNACLINNDNFKIRSNRTDAEVTIDHQEAFLSKIEYSLQVSPEWHLKKKLCSVLEREKAYNLLKNYKDCRLEGDTFKVTLSKHCALTDRDRSIILSQVKATHERIDLATDTGTAVARLEIIMPLESQSLKPTSASPADQNMGKSRAGVYSQSLGLGIWSTIRQAIINYHGESGEALDQSWFSRLESEVDEQNKTIKLKAPNSFFKDWISNHYGQVLDIFSKKHHYHIQVC